MDKALVGQMKSVTVLLVIRSSKFVTFFNWMFFFSNYHELCVASYQMDDSSDGFLKMD